MPGLRITRMVTCALLILPALMGCATRNTYRLDLEPTITQSQFAIIQNFGTADIDASKVDALLGEVAEMLGVTLDHSMRKVRIVVTTPENITGLALAVNSTPSGSVSAMSPRRYVQALYLPRASVAMIPYFDRIILGHELAHYVTDHYLTQTPLAQWEEIADRVERKLWMAKPTPPSPAPAPQSVARGEDASREPHGGTTEDGQDRPRSDESIASEAPDGGPVALLDPEVAAFAEGTPRGEADASVPAPVQEQGVDGFAGVTAVPFGEAEGQPRADELDDRADTLLVQASQQL